jgi:hypothetical protein
MQLTWSMCGSGTLVALKIGGVGTRCLSSCVLGTATAQGIACEASEAVGNLCARGTARLVIEAI